MKIEVNWDLIPLADIASKEPNSFVDGPFGSNLKTDEYTNYGIRLIQLQNIGDGFWVDDNKKFTSERKYQQLKRHSAFPGDLAIAKMAEPVARACIIPPVSDRFLVVADCIKFVPDKLECDLKYILHAINHDFVRHQAELKSTGTTRLRINLSKMKTLRIPIPPLHIQRRIAEIADTIDEAIQKTEVMIEKLKAMKQGLLHDLLTLGLDENGKLRDPKKNTELFKDSPLGRIPTEWDIDTIGDIAVHVGSGLTPRGGEQVYQSSGIMFIRSQNVTFNGLKLDDVAYIPSRTHKYMSRSEIFPYDVLLNITGASIGRCCFFPDGLGQANVNQHVCAIRLPKPTRDDAVYLSSVLASWIGQHQIDILNAGGNREGLNYEQLRSFSIPWPKKSERAMISRALSTLDLRIAKEEQCLGKIRLQKKGLFHDLLTGKVRLKEDTLNEVTSSCNGN